MMTKPLLAARNENPKSVRSGSVIEYHLPVTRVGSSQVQKPNAGADTPV
jgi:hypothetical protein